MKSTIDAINEIKKHLSEKRLSVIVGAGFSKNASDRFSSWKELLHDMIVEMYVDNTNQSKAQLHNLVDNIISEKGYLAIASEYVKRHGYHEVIDQYIEDRTPIVKKTEGEYALLLNEKQLSDQVDLSLHKLLLDLDWNNIYTFNYDNLLDIAAETNKYDEIEAKIANCRHENFKLLNNIQSTEIKIAELENNTLDPQDIIIKLITKEGISNDLQQSNYSTNPFKEYKGDSTESNKSADKKKELQDNINEYKAKIKTNENKIEALREDQQGSFLLVDSAFKISLRKTQNIYKLHGNIRLDKSEKYGFNEDSRCHYIITQEDYDNYRYKHEAFVSLMRIALLQDYFCLIGFSGDDPNFLSWIAWVKDIIDQRARYEKSRSENENEAKIFYIDVSEKPLDKAKELFFKNHYIKHVPLLKKTDDKTLIKSRVKEFLESLKSGKSKAVEAINEYKLFWDTDTYSKKEMSIDYVLGYKRSDVKSVWENREYNRLAKLNSYTCQKRRHIIGMMEKNIQDQTMDEDMAKLLLLAVKGEFLPIGTIIDNESVDKMEEQFKNYIDIQSALKSNRERHMTLVGEQTIVNLPNVDTDESRYESILRILFNLDFVSAKEMVENWETEDIRWRVSRYVLKRILGISKANDIPKLIEFDSLQYNSQELLYTLELLKRLMFWGYTKKEKLEIDKLIDKIKEPDFNNLDDNIEFLTHNIKKQKVNTSPYGDNRIIHNLGSVDLPLIYSIQLLQYLVETVYPIAEKGVSYFNKDDWYSAFKNIYEKFPYPCLFYSLQFGNEKKYLQKIAQDYIYSNNLRLFCEEALVKMLRAYLMEETPSNIKEGILIVASVFFAYVPNKVWQSDFEIIYNSYDFSNRDENRAIFNPIYDFLITGIEHSKSKQFNKKILYEILKLGKKLDNIDNRMIIAAKKNTIIKKQPKKVEESIDYLIAEVSSVSNYFVLFNLQSILTKEQSSLFLEKLLEYDYGDCHEPNMITASLSYGKNTPLEGKIKSEIMENPLLWKNPITIGANGKYIVSSSPYLPLFTIQKLTSFSTEMIEEFYEKMKNSLAKITQYHIDSKDNSFSAIIHPGRVVSEMLLFLEYNTLVLNKMHDYEKTLSDVESIYNGIYKFISIVDALASLDSAKVTKGVLELSYRVQYLGFKNLITEYMIIANIILKRSNIGLSNCIFHFSDAVDNYFEDVDEKLFEPIIRKILDVYQPYFSDGNQAWSLDAKKEMVENAMISLNKTISKWGNGSEFWDKHKRLFNI